MKSTEKAKIFQSSLNFIIFVILGVICYYYLIEDAIKKSEKGATTITSRQEKSDFEYPAIIICQYPGFKPSLSKVLKYTAKDLFRSETSDKHFFGNKTVPQVFEENTYGNSITISGLDGNKTVIPLKEGETKFKFGNVTEIVRLKKVLTLGIGTCHVIFLENENMRHLLVEYKDPINSSDVPGHSNVYILPKNEWQGIVTNYWQGEQPFKFDTSSYFFPSTILFHSTMNKFYPLNPSSEESPASTQCIDINSIKKIRKDQKCKEVCIPIQLSSLFDLSEIKICLDYENHFCAYYQIQWYIYKLSREKQILCTKENATKSYKGQVTYSDGIPYWITNQVTEERRNNILFFMRWTFDSDHITVQQEELMYGPKDLLSWIGGALGIFVGYSIFDLTSLIFDWIFQFVCQII